MITSPPPPIRRPFIHRPGFRPGLSSGGPTGRTGVAPIYSWNHSTLPDHSAHHPPPRVSPWAIVRRPYRPHRGAPHLFVESFDPTGSFDPSSTAQGFAPGYRPAALQAAPGCPPFIRGIIRPYRIIRPFRPYQTTSHIAVRWSCSMCANTPISPGGYRPYKLVGTSHISRWVSATWVSGCQPHGLVGASHMG